LASVFSGIAMAAAGSGGDEVAGQANISAFLMIIMVGNGAGRGHFLHRPIVIIKQLWRKSASQASSGPPAIFDRSAVALEDTLRSEAGVFSAPLRDDGREELAMGCFERPMDHLGVIAGGRRGDCFQDQRRHGGIHGAILLSLLRVTTGGDAVRQMPWGPILMVCGVTVLVSLVEKTQGMDLFTELLARFSTPDTVTAMIAFVTGLISVYSSTSGVVLPAFLPTVPGLSERLGVEMLPIIYSICVGSHLVDISPLSTTGALCIAAAPPAENYQLLFNKVLAWGLSMSVVGAAASWVFFGWL
jgi:hypothetical protein